MMRHLCARNLRRELLGAGIPWLQNRNRSRDLWSMLQPPWLDGSSRFNLIFEICSSSPVCKAIVKHQCFDDLYSPSMVKLGMVYHLSPFLGWFTMEHFLFFHILGMSSPQLTFIFFKMVKTTNQPLFFHFLPSMVSSPAPKAPRRPAESLPLRSAEDLPWRSASASVGHQWHQVKQEGPTQKHMGGFLKWGYP